MSAPLPVEMSTMQGMQTANEYASKTQIQSDAVRPYISRELLPEWEGFHQILVTGSTLEAESVAQFRKTLPITNEDIEIVAFQLLEAWTGVVENIDENSGLFEAQVASEKHSGTREMAQFTFDEISQDDIDLVRPGAVFYWSIGYQVDKFGRRSTQSSLRFKRGKYWTRKDQAEAERNPMFDLDWLKSHPAENSDDSA